MEGKSNNRKILIAAVTILLVSMIGASITQSSGGKVTIKDMRWETASGHLMSALLFIPDGATLETPAPGIVTSHGWYNNREMQDLNYVEWARRGYVVISIDMYGHGHSDAVTPGEWSIAGTGMYDAVKLLVDLPYVDTTRIGVTGHSNGARAANWSIKEDNLRDNPLIASVLLVANDAMYTVHEGEPRYTPFVQPDDVAEYTNNYLNRDVGIIAAQFDEFFFRTPLADGTRTVPGEYINTDYAQSFLNFGANPKSIGEQRESLTFYRQRIGGKNPLRIIYNPYQIHPWNHLSTRVAAQGIEYWEESFGAPRPIPASNQIWVIKLIFNLIGLIGLIMFMVSFSKAMLYTDGFASLRAVTEVEASPPLDGRGRIWFWAGSLATSAFAYISYLKIYGFANNNRPGFLPQRPTYYIGMWSASVGLFLILVLVLTYFFYLKKKGLDLQETGIAIGFKKLLLTIVLAVIVVAATFSVVFIADYFFKVDFRFWVLTVRTFTPDKIGIALMYVPLFLLYYVTLSVATNGFNYFQMGRTEWLNTTVVAGFTALAPALIIAIQYITFFSTGEVFYQGVSNIIGIWAFPFVVVIPTAAVVSRKIYRATRNPYLAGIIWSLFIPMMMASNTLTQM